MGEDHNRHYQNSENGKMLQPLLVSFNCQDETAQNHLEYSLNGELSRSGWPVDLSVEVVLIVNRSGKTGPEDGQYHFKGWSKPVSEQRKLAECVSGKDPCFILFVLTVNVMLLVIALTSPSQWTVIWNYKPFLLPNSFVQGVLITATKIKLGYKHTHTNQPNSNKPSTSLDMMYPILNRIEEKNQ